MRDPGEPALNVFVIELYDLDGELISATETGDVDLNDDGKIDAADETGIYVFAELDPGRYVVREAAADGWVQSAPSEGSYDVTLDAGGTAAGLDFGNHGVGEVHGLKWRDLDGDGQRDNEESGIAGVSIYADLDGDGIHDATEPVTITMADNPQTSQVNETGMYWLTELPLGTYSIREVTPVGMIQTFPKAASVYTNDFGGFVGSEWTDASANTSPDGEQTYLGQFGNKTVTLQYAALPVHTEVRITADLILIGGWDGAATGAADEIRWTLRDPLENSVDQVVVNSSFANPIPSAARQQSFPARLGAGLNPAGTGAVDVNSLGYASDSVYRISFVVPHTSDRLTLDIAALGLEAGDSWGLDNVNITVFGEGQNLTVTAGAVIEDINFGNKPLTSEIQGQKWLDFSGNGKRDLPADVGRDNWEIQLRDNNSVLVQSVMTESVDLNGDGAIDSITERGLYSFTNVLPGTYKVIETPISRYTQTYPDPESNFYTWLEMVHQISKWISVISNSKAYRIFTLDTPSN